MKTLLPCRFWLGSLIALFAVATQLWADTNFPPTATVLSAVQRPGTTYMDIDFQVNDPDDATVEIQALGFVNGGTKFSDIVKISTLMEGTATNLGISVPANTSLHLTWNVAADWNTNFGNVQVEILARDNRGLLPFTWVTLPAHGSDLALTLNTSPIYDADLLPIWYWLVATNDPGIILSNGVIYGVSGDYQGQQLASGTTTTPLGRGYVGSKLDFRPANSAEINRAAAGPYGNQTFFQSLDSYAVARGYTAPRNRIWGWGANGSGQLSFPANAYWWNIRSLVVGGDSTVRGFTIALDGTSVIGWGQNLGQMLTIPAKATNVTAIAAGYNHALALRADGYIITWGAPGTTTNMSASATNFISIAAGYTYSLAARADGTVLGWGNGNVYGQFTIPVSATNVIAVAAFYYHSFALRRDGTVVQWGLTVGDIPITATNITAIAAGYQHCLALRSDGTVIGWGNNSSGQLTIPASATNVIAIAAGYSHSVALRGDGSVIVWGENNYGQTNIPAGVASCDLISSGANAAYSVIAVDRRNP